jgi:hypothetical protein
MGCLGPLSKHFCCVIKPHEESFRIEIEDLFSGMSRDVRREKDLEAPPGIMVFLPGIYFLNFEAFAKE